MKRYDRAYFDRWYRGSRRIHSSADVERKVRMVVGIAEQVLERPIRTVLDVGCGEGAWLPALRRLRPGVRYSGVDSSEYVVRRFGARRNIRLGSVDRLDELEWPGRFDVVVCCDVLNYLPARVLARGLAQMRALLGGVAYLELFTDRDEMAGDLRGWHFRPAAYYRRLLRRLGYTPCGCHCYVGPQHASDVAMLERGFADR